MYRNIKSPEEFAAEFNLRFPDAYRKVTVEDVNNMIECHLIWRYGFYLIDVGLDGRYGFVRQDDFETARGVLQYEQLFLKKTTRQVTEQVQEPAKCKGGCGRILPNEVGKPGRPREYCAFCENKRNRERQHKHRHTS
jgi:hypothetical protein